MPNLSRASLATNWKAPTPPCADGIDSDRLAAAPTNAIVKKPSSMWNACATAQYMPNSSAQAIAVQADAARKPAGIFNTENPSKTHSPQNRSWVRHESFRGSQEMA